MKVGFSFLYKTSACMNYATLKFEAKSHCVFARSKKHLSSSLQIHCEKRRPKTNHPKCWLFRAHKCNQHLQMGEGERELVVVWQVSTSTKI
jgi:hypothetical protein